MTTHPNRGHGARIVGRSLRLLLGAALVWMTYDVIRTEDAGFNLRVLGVVVALTGFYAAMHLVIGRYVPTLNRRFGAILAVSAVVLVYVLGGPLGRVASVAYVGISLVLQGARGDGGCEVMALPGILLGKRTDLICIAFSPIDWVEERVAARRS